MPASFAYVVRSEYFDFFDSGSLAEFHTLAMQSELRSRRWWKDAIRFDSYLALSISVRTFKVMASHTTAHTHTIQIVMFYSFNPFSIGKMYSKFMYNNIFLLNESLSYSDVRVCAFASCFFNSSPFSLCDVCMHQAIGKQIRKSNMRDANECVSHKNANMNARAELNRKTNSIDAHANGRIAIVWNEFVCGWRST